MQDIDILHKLYKQEFTKMVAVISKTFGLGHIEIAEDIVAETFMTATENWQAKGVPESPVAWLYAVAKQKTLYHFRRSKIFDEKVAPLVRYDAAKSEEYEPDFSSQSIKDNQLQMLFAVCDPAIAGESQIGLALRILCGFGIDEIAEAFFTNKETVNKRLFRAKEKLRESNIKMEMPAGSEVVKRLDIVLHVIYLLFNEGYYSTTQNRVLRKELCLEALRLGLLLTEFEITNVPKTNALIALMCFHASRFDAREAGENGVLLYEEQDADLWDKELIAQGLRFLTLSAEGSEMTSYHIEARIALWHCTKEDTVRKWEEILQLYNQLLMINYSPAVAINRTYALYKANGWKEALVEAEKLKLENSHFYYVLLGELYSNSDIGKAEQNYRQALALVRNEAERRIISNKIGALH